MPEDRSVETIIENMSDKQLLDRREVRVHCRINVQFMLADLNDYGTCWNLGLHGMYVAYEGDVTCGACLDLCFVISDEFPALIESSARVVWLNTGKHYVQKQLPEGFGVEFINLGDEAKTTIRNFLQLD
ncbi:PilZ domain-containing protein [Geobacter pelophilus]|uniref:PilZ domain-containing protein n=1 Tax=Geoanaerobacter pelophilus TaxID=60036 RepID=A0AAW4L3P2_9BACT|nr:PilZ domain-containing protein [Geoanaerobacter pelophilus]MBT0664817.1 PilZ domain-containing protein [Geoanaerobacter pelophilus]